MKRGSSQPRSPIDEHGARALSGNEIKRLLWYGVRIINPSFPRRLSAGYYVCNTHRPEHGDGHWVAVRVNPCGWTGEFFDPYGHPPHVYGLEGFMTRSVRGTWKFNSVPIQGPESYTCGHHCIMYCTLSLGGVPMEKYVRLFEGKSFAYNDKLAIAFVRRLSKKNDETARFARGPSTLRSLHV